MKLPYRANVSAKAVVKVALDLHPRMWTIFRWARGLSCPNGIFVKNALQEDFVNVQMMQPRDQEAAPLPLRLSQLARAFAVNLRIYA